MRFRFSLLILLLFIPGAGLRGWSSSPVTDDSSKEKTEDVYIEEAETLYRAEDSGVVETTIRLKFKVLTEVGRQANGHATVSYQSELSEVQFNYVKTIKPDGSVVEAKVDQPLEVSPPVTQQAPMFSDLKIKVIPIPALQVGDRVEWEVVTRQHTPLKPGDFWLGGTPIRNLRVLSERITLDLPADRKVMLKLDDDLPPEITEGEGRRIYRWKLSNPKPLKGKILQKQLFRVTSFNSWEEVGKWYQDLQKGRDEPTPEIKGLAQKLVEGKTKPKEKFDAIFRHVSQSIRYVGISLGIGGYQAHAAGEVLKNEYGDCKDKHNLLTAMLKAVGVEVYPALIHSSARLESSIPAPDQFNHVVSVVKLGEKWIWADATQEVAPADYVPKVLRGTQALVILPKGARLMETPQEFPGGEWRRASMVGKIDEKGNLEAKLTYENRGEAEVSWRQVFRRANPEALQYVLRIDRPRAFWNSESENITNSDPLDLEKPFRLEYTLKDKRFVDVMERSDRVNPPALLTHLLPWSFPKKDDEEKAGEESEESPKTEDEEDYELGGPSEFQEDVELTVAPMFRVHVPPSTRIERDFAVYESSYQFEGNKLLARRQLRFLQRKLSASRRDEFKSFLDLLKKDRDQKMIFERIGELDLRALADDMTANELNDAGRDSLQKGKLKLARDLLMKAVEKEPKHKYAWTNLGRVRMSYRDFEKAQEAFEKQIEITPRGKNVYAHMGWLFMGKDQPEEAVVSFKKQIEIDPLNSYAHAELARAYIKLKQWGLAEVELKRAVEIGSVSNRIFVELGESQLRQGKIEAAKANFEKAIEKRGDAGTLNSIAYTLAEADHDLDLARRYAESAVRRMEDEMRLRVSVSDIPRIAILQASLGAYIDTLGWVLFRQGELKKSAKNLETAFHLTFSPVVAEHLIKVLIEKREKKDALNYYKIALDLSKSRRGRLTSEFRTFMEENFGGSAGLKNKLKEIRRNNRSQMLLKPRNGSFIWPEGETVEDTQKVILQCLLDGKGNVKKVKVFVGSGVWRKVAEENAGKIAFEPVIWNGQPLETVRLVEIRFHPDRTIEARDPVKEGRIFSNREIESVTEAVRNNP